MLRLLQGHDLTKRFISTVKWYFHALTDRLEHFFIVRLIVRTVAEMSHDDATHMAAGVAYYALFSMFPLLLGLAAVLSLVGLGGIQESLTDFFTSFLPGSEEFVLTNIGGVPGALGILAVVGLFWSGSAIFGAITRAVNRAWDVHKDRPLYLSKARQLVMALGVGAMFLLSVGTTTVVAVVEQVGVSQIPVLNLIGDLFSRVIVQGVSYVFTIGIFLMIYKFLPNTKTYWKFIWPGALLAAVLFEFSKSLFITYLERFATFNNLYGSLSPVIVFLFWTYVVSLILILGAELSSEYGRMRTGVSRGELLHPHEDRPSRFGGITGSGVNGVGLEEVDISYSDQKAGYVGRPHRAALLDDSVEKTPDRSG